MSLTPEQSRGLYDETAATVVDTTGDPKPEDFDPQAFIAGMRPTRRAVKLYQGGDLLARLDQLAAKINATPDGDPALDAMIDEFDQIRGQYTGGAWWEVEGRSDDWVDRLRRQAAADLGHGDIFDPDRDDLGLPLDVRQEILMRQLAAQIVVPSGVTVDMLKLMQQQAEPELGKLFVAVTFCNKRLGQSSDVLTVDFSQRRSGNRRQRRSSARSK